MKAIVAQRYGGPEALGLAQRREPEVGPTDVLITVRAAGLNPLDYKIRNGNVKPVFRFVRRSDSAVMSQAWSLA